MFVRPRRRARNVKSLRTELPPVLRQLELAGRTEIPRRARAGDPIDEALRRMGLTRAYQAETEFPGSIYVMPDLPVDRAGTFISTTGDALPGWIEDFVADPEQAHNLRKLVASAAAEKHLFLLVPAVVTTAPMPVTDVLLRGITPSRR